MNALVFGIISLFITMLGVVIGIVNIVKKKTMFFFTLIICAVACFAIEQLSMVVNLWCGILDDIWVGALGVFAGNFFLLSANYGEIDSVVSEHELPGHKRLAAFLAPVILVITIIAVFVSWKDYDLLSAVVLSILLVPAVPASYYNVKHLLLDMDTLGILKATRPCDVASLLFYLMIIIYLCTLTFLPTIFVEIAAIAVSLSMLLLAFAVVRGIKSWEILI